MILTTLGWLALGGLAVGAGVAVGWRAVNALIERFQKFYYWVKAIFRKRRKKNGEEVVEVEVEGHDRYGNLEGYEQKTVRKGDVPAHVREELDRHQAVYVEL